ncbi:hypothetical protein Ahy_A03g016205 [Arachis hypogaea]|uniref:Bifunctional inhibitor/plant lipid transfer protein/seed storage helical domain-containing protein n=1 Tax=Arachis hypogaea TaxID=3818 RepID=A0A445E2I3_ARAHY|nr:hypothetical protein Ahy_A03g016205 [Arachis hypogaea]
MRNISTLLSLATVVVACSIIYNTEKVSGQCGGSVPALISECGQYVQKSGPKVPPSAECCSELLKLDVPCACNFVTKDVVNLISVPKALFVAHYCGMKLTPGMQCGGYSSAVKLEIEKFDGRINFGLWQVQVNDVLIQSGRWLKNFQEKPIWKLHHEFSARFRSVPRQNSWSGLIPRYSSAVKLEIEKFDGRINFGLWQIQVKDVLIQSGRWLKNFQEKPIWKLHHEFSARFRSVPRRNSWSGLIPSEYTFMVEYDSSLNYDCRYRQWQQRIVGVDNGS